jgi:hypothetical protein
MGTGFATVREQEGVSVTSAEVNGFTLSELRFPESYLQAHFEPELPYLAVVLEGAARPDGADYVSPSPPRGGSL